MAISASAAWTSAARILQLGDSTCQLLASEVPSDGTMGRAHWLLAEEVQIVKLLLNWDIACHVQIRVY